MRRSEHLKPLSWEHHDALKYARRLRRGVEKGVDPKTLRRYLHQVVEKHLRPHFALEESILIGRLGERQRQHEAVQQVLSEHREMLELAGRIEAERGDIAPLLLDFADKVKQHVKLEETRFLPFIEESLPVEDLLQVQEELEAGHVKDAVPGEPPFWSG